MTLLKVKALLARFSGGTIALTAEQAADRAHNLQDNGDGTYEILHPIEFRHGEIVDFGGDVSPALLESVELAETPLEDLPPKAIVAQAATEGLTLDARRKKADLIQALLDFRVSKAAQSAQDPAADAKAARIQELQAKGDAMTPDEAAELLTLKA